MRYTTIRTALLTALIAGACTLAVIPLIANAQNTPGFVPLAPVNQQSSRLTDLYATTGGLSNFINAAFKFAISIGAIVAVLRIAWAGYLYMGAADMWSTKSRAKEILGNVTFGLLLLLGIYLILYQINPDIVQLSAFRNIKPVPASPVQTGGTQDFTTQPAQNSFFGGASGYDPNINGLGVSGNETGGAEIFAP